MYLLVGQARAQFFKVGGRHLVHQVFRRTQRGGDSPHLALAQPAQGGQVAGAVAEFGEEAHHRFGGMVGADHQAIAGVGQGVLGQHAQARLDVAEDEIPLPVSELGQLRQLPGKAVDAVCNVHRDALIGADEGQCGLGIGLVMLGVVRQAHGDEAVVAVGLFAAQLLDRQLRQAPGG
ncbi:hypothetical protein D9M71_543350 [compost metagenome]